MRLIAFSSEVASGSREENGLDKNPKPASDQSEPPLDESVRWFAALFLQKINQPKRTT
jgi:hypothetical protein